MPISLFYLYSLGLPPFSYNPVLYPSPPSRSFSVHVATTGKLHNGNRGYVAELHAMGIHTHTIKLNDASFDAFVAGMDAGRGPAMAVFDRFSLEEQFGWRVRKVRFFDV